jgi:DNA (cytosine-5)-methyltransferase 1
MSKPRLLDLYCKAAGASMGYYRAGFDVVGVDIEPQPRYPFPFILGDAIDAMTRMLAGERFLATDGNWYGLDDFDAFAASPPCQAYSKSKALATPGKYEKLIEPTRDALIATGRPFVIENVPGAPLKNPTLLCGMMFGLPLYRHRLFEHNFPVPFLMDYGHGLKQDTASGPNAKRDIVLVFGHAKYKGYRKRAADAMGIDWGMTEGELAEAIPPAFTEFIGRKLMEVL